MYAEYIDSELQEYLHFVDYLAVIDGNGQRVLSLQKIVFMLIATSFEIVSTKTQIANIS